MKRIRQSKEKSIYAQIIYCNPKNTDIKDFEGNYFNNYLPHRFMVLDKKVKELKECKVRFKILGTWREGWPLAKIIEVIHS